MARQQIKCPRCGADAHIVSENRIEQFGQVFKSFSCGHTALEEIIKILPASKGMSFCCRLCLKMLNEKHEDSEGMNHDACVYENSPSVVEIPTGRLPHYSRLRVFQRQGVLAIEKANFNFGLFDEMGLGKTVQVGYAIKQSQEYFDKVLYVVKASLRLNWANEMMNNEWVCDMNDPRTYPFILLDGKSALLPGFRHYIIPFSLLAKFKDELSAMKFKLMVVDESQAFSNMNTARTKALLEIAQGIPHKVCMSGTPILNRGSEYFPALHLIKPDHWYNYASFVRNWIASEATEGGGTRLTGILPYRRDAFFAKIAPYTLRRRKRDVLKDLPPFRRNFYVVDISESNIKNAYNKQAAELDHYINSKEYSRASAFERSGTLLGYLMRMRHLCGVGKSVICVEQAIDFLESTEDDTKLIIGVHHDDVMDVVREGLKVYNPIILPSGLDPIVRTQRIEEFKTPRRRVCIAKILAQGEGLNLQFCHNMIVLERMWNPGKEEQFEARIDRYGQLEPTTADYIVAKGTVDEDFSEIVEGKRKNCGGSIDQDYDFEMDATLMGMLAERAARRRL